MSSVIRRKPLPPSAKIPDTKRLSVLPGSDVHPTMRLIWCDEKKVRVSNEEAAKSPIFNRLAGHEIEEDPFFAPNSPHIYGDQLFAALPYSTNKDSDAWENDGDCVICIGRNVDLRINSALILKSKYGSLIDKLQGMSSSTQPTISRTTTDNDSELNDDDSFDFTEAAPLSTVPIRYILELPDPIKPLDSNRYRTSIRNFFAALRNKPIAGDDLVAELDHLHSTAMDLLGSHSQPEKATRFVRKYVQRLKLDDCRYLRTNAIRMLAWCERTRWEKGWIESFAHCVGMMGNGIEESPAFKELSPQTRKLLQRSHYKQREEILAMQRILLGFEIAGNRPSAKPGHAAGLRSALAFQQFLRDYYGGEMGTWPPSTGSGGGYWLTRTLTQRLQEDFGGLYDLLVDKSVVYTHEGDGETPKLVRLNGQDKRLPPLCVSRFPLEKTLSSWNEKCGFENIPHPWPLLPRSRATSPPGDQSENKASLLAALRELDVDPVQDQNDLRNAYTHGTNPDIQPSHFSKAFLDHESTTRLDSVNTHDARLGRWLVIHCIMQLLSRISVDIQGLWYCHGVPYHLNADLKHCPPWDGAQIPATMRQVGVRDSWCWIFAKGVVEARPRLVGGRAGKGGIPRPRFRIRWGEDGRWELIPARGVAY